jgi:hypothetical protein
VSLIEALWNMRLSRPLNEMIELTHVQTRILKRYAKRRLSDAAEVLASMQVSMQLLSPRLKYKVYINFISSLIRLDRPRKSGHLNNR